MFKKKGNTGDRGRDRAKCGSLNHMSLQPALSGARQRESTDGNCGVCEGGGGQGQGRECAEQ